LLLFFSLDFPKLALSTLFLSKSSLAFEFKSDPFPCTSYNEIF
jgi:hypothetical protein